MPGKDEIHAALQGASLWFLCVCRLFNACSITPSDVVLHSTLVDQSALLQGWMERVGSFLERVEAALSKLPLLPAMLQTAQTVCPSVVADVCSTKDKEVELYGSFSPRAREYPSFIADSPHVSS